MPLAFHTLARSLGAARDPALAHVRGAHLSRACAVLLASIGALVLIGWTADIPQLRSLGPAGWAATNPLAAVCFIGVGTALWLLSQRASDQQWRVARAIAGGIAVVGFVRLLASVASHDLAIDAVLFRDAMSATADGRSNRMSAGSAANLLLIGVALLLLARRQHTRVALAQGLASVVLALASTALLAHVYRSGWFNSIGQFNRMAVPTCIAFAVIAIGTLALRRETGVLAVVLSDGPGGTMARALLPTGLLAPAIFGWIALLGLRSSPEAAGPDLIVTLCVMATILVFVGLITRIAMQVHQTHVERARVEAALRDSEVRFRLLAENGSDIVSLHDISGRVLYMSPSCERVLGFTPEDVMRMSPFAMVHPDDGDRLRRHFDDLIRGAPVTALSCRMLHKTGKHLWLEMMWRAVREADGRITSLQASSRDITERRDYERQLEDTRRKLQANHESLVEANARLAALASHDGLTGLKNRRAFEERLFEELSRIRRTQQPVALLLIDIDHFKAFNDAFGHPRGDEILRAVARVLARSIRDTDVAVRYGGEEFAVILPNTDTAGAHMMGERLREAIESAPWTERAITVSVGAATATSPNVPMDDLLDRADRALYRSKQFGRNRVTLADVA
ncbi:MAG: GGDEF domain-containing protein [Gemmatimonadaceae bacterium]|nr:GGDEF domain-containing protein [Gemmatimonadaceae bacterium]